MDAAYSGPQARSLHEQWPPKLVIQFAELRERVQHVRKRTITAPPYG
jgi:hypothetical protein